MSGRAFPSLGPIRGAGIASVYLRPGSFLSKMSNRMLKKSASGVLASLRGSTYRSVRLASSLAAALLDSLFEHPGVYGPIVLPVMFQRWAKPKPNLSTVCKGRDERRKTAADLKCSDEPVARWYSTICARGSDKHDLLHSAALGGQ
jgi:hypothetical protein